MQVGNDGVIHQLRGIVERPKGCSDGCVSIRVHLGLNRNGQYSLNSSSSLEGGLELSQLKEGQILVVDVAGKQVVLAKPAPKPFTLNGLNCTTAFFHSVKPETGDITLMSSNLSQTFLVSAQTILMQPCERVEALRIVKQGNCLVNVWAEPNFVRINDIPVEAMSVNFR
jgi:CRISPR/Cas system CMR-associated protein Cmr5 small subunit